MTGTPQDPGGRSDPSVLPDALRPPDPTESITIVCPYCEGGGVKTVERVCGPTTTSPCGACTTAGRIDVYWASARDELDSARRTHLVQVDTAPAEPLCDHDPIPAGDLAGRHGVPCLDCLNKLNRQDTVEHRMVQLTGEFDCTRLMDHVQDNTMPTTPDENDHIWPSEVDRYVP